MTDANSQNVARELSRNIERLTGERPHLIIMHLHRNRVDANRPLEEAVGPDSARDPIAERAWYAYHGRISSLTKSLETGLLIDVHGQGNKPERVELGYGLGKKGNF